MNLRLKRALSILLAVAMMASFLILPAAADDEDDVASWDLSVATVTVQNDKQTWEDLDIDATATGAKWAHNGNWTQVTKDTIIKVPVVVPDGLKAIVTIRAYAEGTFTVDGQPNKSAGTKEEFTCAGTDGWVTIVGLGGQGYLSYIGVRYAEADLPVSLLLNPESVDLIMGGDNASVTATILNATATDIQAVAAAEEIVGVDVDFDAEDDDNSATITLTPLADGDTTVNVTVTLDEGEQLTGEIAVTVIPAKDPDATIAEGEYIFSGKNTHATDAAIARIQGLDVGNLKVQDNTGGNNHGIVIPSGSTVTLNLGDKKATLTVFGCEYGAGMNLAMASSSGEVTTSTGTNSMSETAPKFVVEGATGETILTFTSSDNKSSWIHSIEVEYEQEAEPPVDSSEKRIDVWDLAGLEETNTGLYTNHITPSILTAATWKGSSDKFLQAGGNLGGSAQDKAVEFDRLTFVAGNNDRFYSNITALKDYTYATSDAKYIGHNFGDGYTNAGGIFTNGAGSATRRAVTISGVKVGDTVVAYLGNNQAETTFGVVGLDAPTVKVGKSEFDTLSFVAAKAGSYTIYDTGGGKPGFLRIMVIPPVTVSGSITLPGDFDATGWGLRFVDTDTGDATAATVTGNTYTVELAPDRTYNASLTSASGWGTTTETKQVKPGKDNITTGLKHDLEIEAKSQYTYSGTITGFAGDYDTSRLAITMIADDVSKSTAGAEDVKLDIDKTALSFSALLDPGVTYTLKLEGVNDYQIKSPDRVYSDDDKPLTGQKIEVESKALVAASGKFVILDTDDQFAPLYDDSTYAPLPATVTSLKFKNVDDGYTYEAAVSNGAYSVSLRAGAYEAVVTVDGYKTNGHVVVADKAVTKDLLFVSTATPAAVDYASDVYVDGKGGSDLHFKTVTGAMAYIKRMTRTDTQRVTVHIAPGTYREQINIDSKNVTFVNDNPGRDVVLTWYYGIGYTYYSASTDSNSNNRWYDPQNAFDKYTLAKTNIARWGCTVRVTASGFQAQDITFENSFNYYLTEEELIDGVIPSEAESIRFAREYGANVTSKAATERAAVLYVASDTTEFKNCKFLSSQDTIITGGRMYFKDCYIEGMTDYICGPGDVVFDTCTLNWKGYSDSTTGGYVTAPQTGESETGYLFRSCYISGDTKLQLGAGGLGRTWGEANTGCIFLNTTLQSADMIAEPTWAALNEFLPSQATRIKEWGTVLLDGTGVDLSKRTLQNTVATSAPVVNVEKDYFGNWDPDYYTAEVNGVALDKAPTVTNNGDINLPRPGNTLTVVYTLTPAANNANDASTIEWYRVAADGTQTLVKKSVNAADRTYYIQAEDVGCHIMVTVTPRTIGGQTGTSLSYTVAEPVAEGFDDPTGSTDPVLGSGVNVFLAGDSTVKDYSAAGMWNKGSPLAEGSWGEFLQLFFNDKVTIVNYAQGGRTTRSFIETDGSLDKIDATMKEGDFLFIQFGHNDCYSADSRYVPLGIANGDAQKSYAEGGKYPDTTSNGETTYTGYLKKYIEVTEKHKATAVLMTPVARMYYTSDGTIRPHHDATAEGTSDNEYCKAVRWVYDWAVDQGYNVAFQDNFQLTAELFEKAYADCSETDRQTYGRQLMGEDEKTHNNKLGGLIEATIVASAIQNSNLTIAKAVKAPAQVQGKTPTGETVFTVNGSGVLAAFDMLSSPAYSSHASYWEGKGQDMFDAIAARAKELNPDDSDATYTVTVTGGTVNGAASASFAAGDSVTVNATVPSRKTFEKWTATGLTLTAAQEGVNPLTFSMPAGNVTLTAIFKDSNPGGDNPGGGDEEPDTVDTTALEAAIAAANEAAAAVLISENGSNVLTTRKWVTEDVMNEFKAAIEAAESALSATTQAAVDNALAALAAAQETFVAAQKSGTRRSSNTNSGGGVPNTPGNTGSDNSNSNSGNTTPSGSNTTTTTNPDGSTTTTTTNPNGTVTSTTTATDGTTTTTTTESDGTVTTTKTETDGSKTETVDKPDGSKTETVTRPDGSSTETVTKADGAKSEIVKDAAGDVTVTATSRSGEVVAKVEIPAVVPELSYKFEDVPSGHWAERAINTMAALNVVSGESTENHVFNMDSNITRGAMAQILYNLSNGTPGKSESFGDVFDGAWYTDAVAWAADAGVVTGYSDATFGPDDSITREQLAVMLCRYADLLGLNTSASSAALSGFADVGSVSSWSTDAMAWAVSNGLIQGKGENNLDPAASASRAETAVILQRFLDLIK